LVEKVTSAVWQPPTDGPVGRDFDVRVALAVRALVRDRFPRRWSTYVFLALVCLVAGLVVSSVLAVTAAVVMTAAMFQYWRQAGRSMPDVQRLLDAEPARLVDVEPVSRRLARVDGRLLRLHLGYQNMPLWLVGPDGNGLAVAFYGPVSSPRPVRVVHRRPLTAAPAPLPRSPLQRARTMVLVAGGLAVVRWTFILAITVSIGLELAPQPPVLAGLFGVAGIVIAVRLARDWRQFRPALLMRRQLAAPLTDHPARALRKRSVAVTLPDGAELVGKLVLNFDVLSSVRASGRLWVAGTPAAGALLAVGVPDQPIAGMVRFDKGGNDGG
jgi:hypothetical protein